MKIKQPRDFFKCGNITDALIVTDDWYTIDDKMNYQLEAYKDKNIFDKNRDKNIAQSFIAKAEKLLKNNCVDYGDNSPDADLLIKELRKEIKNYDQWKVFMQTLRLAILTFRAGYIPEMAQVVVKLKRVQAIKGGKEKTIDGITPGMRSDRDKNIIEDFNKSRLTSINRFADKHAAKYEKQYGLKPRTIRHILSRTVGIQPG
jgi:hypothetical protein